jgi:hypothetical protein
MFKNTAARVLAAGVVAAALVATSAVAANAATPAGSAGPFWLIDSGTGEAVTPGSTFDWLTDVSGNPSPSNPEFTEMFVGPADSTSVVPYISPRGSEGDPSAWVAYGFGGFTDPVAKTVLMSPARLSGMTLGTLGANGVKATGGDYSLGFAFVRNNGLTVSTIVENGKPATYFTHISITPVTGTWTFDTPDASGPVDPTDPVPFEVDLNAETMDVPQGNLSLVAPTASAVAIGNPQIVNGLSTSTGTLGKFSVVDERFQTHEGWTLTTSVTDFTNQGDTTKVIDAAQLNIAPAFVGTPNPEVTLANAHAAGTDPGVLFAQANNTVAAGTVDLQAGLTFVSPANMPAGTYTSKMTVTLASK